MLICQGFLSIFVAVFIVTVGVTTYDRPYAAPPGVTDFGVYAITPMLPTFAAGVTACVTIFVSSAGTVSTHHLAPLICITDLQSAFIPVISEMRKPQEFRKALYFCMAFVAAVYVAFSLVIYRYCGRYVASFAQLRRARH
jgi:hypothetical protein